MPGHLFAPAPDRRSGETGRGGRPRPAGGRTASRRRAASTAAGFALALAIAPFIPLVAAAPAAPATQAPARPAASLPFGYIVSPGAGRPGEVVRIELLTNLRQTTGRILTTRLPTIRFWWSREPAIQTIGRFDEQGNVLAELVVPFSAGRGLDPIVVAVDVPPTPTPTPRDTIPPVIKGIDWDTNTLCVPTGTPDRVTFFASVTDDTAVTKVILFYKRPGDSQFQSLDMTLVGGTYRATLVVNQDDQWFPTETTDQLTFSVAALDTANLSTQSPPRTAIHIDTECAPPSPTGPVIFLGTLPPIFFPTPTPVPGPIINSGPNAGELGAAFALDPPGARPVDPGAEALPIQVLGELPFVVTKSAGPPNWQH